MAGNVVTLGRPRCGFVLRSTHCGARLRAAATAELLDRLVDSDLVLVRALPVDQREQAAGRLLELVLLAQSYRHYAAGWIGRRQLYRRARAAGLEQPLPTR